MSGRTCWSWPSRRCSAPATSSRIRRPDSTICGLGASPTSSKQTSSWSCTAWAGGDGSIRRIHCAWRRCRSCTRCSPTTRAPCTRSRASPRARARRIRPISRGIAGPDGRVWTGESAPPRIEQVFDSSSFVHLDVRSCFSLKEGAFTPEQLARRAAELGSPAVAMTDRDGLYGAARFVQACEREGVTPLVGASLTVRAGGPDIGPDTHVVLLATDDTGYANLCRLITDAH